MVSEHDEVDLLLGAVGANLVGDRLHVGSGHPVHGHDQVTRLQLLVRRTADGHRGDGGQLLDRLACRPEGSDHRVVLRGLHHLRLGLLDLVGALARREDGVPRQRVPAGHPVGRQRLRQRESGVGAGAGHDGEVELAGRGEGRHLLDRDQRMTVDLAEHIGRAARAPGHERHRQDRQRHRQRHEQQRGDQGGPGLSGHDPPDHGARSATIEHGRVTAVPPRSTSPEVRCCSFQIGTVCLRSSISARQASSAGPR